MIETLPAVITIPAAPGPDAECWVCPCGKTLGVVSNGFVFSRHKDKEVDACLPARIQCPRCGKKNTRCE